MGTEVQGAVARQSPGPTAGCSHCSPWLRVSAVVFRHCWPGKHPVSGVVKGFRRSKNVVIDEVKNKGLLRKDCLSSIASV